VPSQSHSSRILIVDDDEGLLVLMSEALRTEGYNVVSASSGREAMNSLGERAPDLMLLDLKLADTDGPALIERLQRGESRVPFIVVTGQGDEKVAVEVMKHGALDYLIKSTALLDLLPGVVKRTLEGISQKKALVSAQSEVLAAGERERLSIGADLHDGLGQQLTAIEFMCAAMKEDAASTNPAFAKRLEQMCTMLREAVAQTRLLAHGLVPLGRSPDALQTGLSELAARTNDLGGLRCRFECGEPVSMTDPTVAGHLYRIAQEATNNAIKHARADRVTIRLGRRGANLRLEISDNGIGLPKDPGDRQGLGLRVMRDRASLIGAELSVGTTRGKGVTIVCTRPIKE
jgi:signal transduction histidine kinase